MQVKLTVLSGKSSGQSIVLPGDEFLIGRDERCQLRPKSPEVGRVHCRLRKVDGALFVSDMGAPAGTLVNGKKIEGRVELASGDKLVVGPLEFEVTVEYELGGRKREKVRDIRDVAARTAQRSKNREVDLDDIFNEPDPPKTTERVFSLDDIKVVVHEEKKEEPEEEKKSSKPGKKPMGKLPERPKEPEEQPKDTREAASNMLKEMFKKK